MAVFEYIGGGGGSSSVVGYPEGTKMYLALLTQSGTDAPVATVLVNTLGGTLVWSYEGVGLYQATLAGAFTANKTWFNYDVWSRKDLDGDSTAVFKMNRGDANSMVINVVTSFADDSPINGISPICIQILVFP